MLYLQLFWEFFKTGLFAVGGGLATLPFLQDMADRTGWFTHAQLADMLAVSESTPGPIGVNMATYVGFTTGGIGGALVATIGLVTPSVIVILIVAAFLKAFRDSKWVSAAFYGLRPASTALIAAALAFAFDMPLVLILVGIIYIIETVSVIMQVTYFKLTHGKRIFRMTPIHHHFEMGGWSEVKIFTVFTGITVVMCILAFLGVRAR